MNINMTFNTRITVCMIFNPSDRGKIVAKSFPAFTLSSCSSETVNQFKYLGHILIIRFLMIRILAEKLKRYLQKPMY